MIKKEEVYKIGKLTKPHGVKGEIGFNFTNDIFDRTECEYLILQLDGILVPFFIEEYRFRSDTTALMTFDGIDSLEKAKNLANAEVFFPKKYADEDSMEARSLTDLFAGYTVCDVRHGKIGTIVHIDDSTDNILAIIETAGKKEVMIPFHEDLIALLDEKGKAITFDLPDGMLIDADAITVE